MQIELKGYATSIQHMFKYPNKSGHVMEFNVWDDNGCPAKFALPLTTDLIEDNGHLFYNSKKLKITINIEEVNRFMDV